VENEIKVNVETTLKIQQFLNERNLKHQVQEGIKTE